ncbi:membrane protein [Bacillaceae bacterium JMAK1]|nr:membrane protein [Bacillaceae bacterium JMAK1]
MKNQWIATGAILAMLAVAIGAFGAHGLEGSITDNMLENYHTGVQYHMFHALGILVVGIIIGITGSSKLLQVSATLLFIGILIFSGSLYIMALTNMTWLGAVTPIGGVSFIIGWLCLTFATLKGR